MGTATDIEVKYLCRNCGCHKSWHTNSADHISCFFIRVTPHGSHANGSRKECKEFASLDNLAYLEGLYDRQIS